MDLRKTAVPKQSYCFPHQEVVRAQLMKPLVRCPVFVNDLRSKVQVYGCGDSKSIQAGDADGPLPSL